MTARYKVVGQSRLDKLAWNRLAIQQQVATRAAQLMSEGYVDDYQQARLKAAKQLGVFAKAGLPELSQIEAALREYQALFAQKKQSALCLQREAAVQAMQFFKDFSPRLSGAVLDGIADSYSSVLLHLHCDEAEAVARFLEDTQLGAQCRFKEIYLNSQQYESVPLWRFHHEGQDFELLVLPSICLRQAPLNTLTGKPISRASLSQLEGLLTNSL